MFGWSSLDDADEDRLIGAIAGGEPTPSPLHAVVDLTDGCDVAAHLNRHGPIPWPDAPPLERLEPLLDRLADAGVRSVRLGATGEPLLHPDLGAVVSGLVDREIAIDEVVTTGIPATDDIVARLVELPCRTVRVLAAAARPADFMRMTGIDQFHFYRLVETVERLVTARGERTSPRMALHFVIHRENLSDLPRMYGIGRDLGVDEIVVGPCFDLGPELELGELTLRPEHQDELVGPLAEALETDRERRLLRLCFPWPNRDELIASLRSRVPDHDGALSTAPSFDERDNGHCLLGWVSLSVDSSGDAHACPLLAGSPDRPALGSIDEQPLGELWHGDAFDRLRDEMHQIFLAQGRLFSRSGRFRRLAPRCVAPHACTLKNRYRLDDEAFHGELTAALGPARREPTTVALGRRIEEAVYRIYHGALTRLRASRRLTERHRDIESVAPSSTPTDEPASIPSLDSPRLHIGSGIQRLDDWLNVDIENLPGVDLALDIREGLPFDGVEAIFAEHFLEHLTLDEALDFLVEARRILRDGAGIRLSTPSLDWVVDNVYDSADDEDERLQGALRLNRAFHGWGHRFLWNRPLLAAALRATGFADLRWCRHGESDIELFRGLERHETYADTPELPHVLIVEARPGRPDVAALDALRERLASEFLDYVDAAE